MTGLLYAWKVKMGNEATMSLDVFEWLFMDIFFHCKMREAKFEELMNPRQGSTSV